MQASRSSYSQNILPQSLYSSNSTNKNSINSNNFQLNLNFHPNHTGHDDFKNQYSTFIQQLQETTQKLMNQVFNTEYKPDVGDLWEEGDQVVGQKIKSRNKNFGKNKAKINGNLSGRNVSGGGIKTANFGSSRIGELHLQSSQSFQNFMTRNNKWCEKKQSHLLKQTRKKQLQQSRQLRAVPQILRGSIQKLQPIYERALEIHASKQKKLAYKKIQQKKKQDQQINSYSFHPQIISKNKTRTLEQYLQDKKQWEKKRNQGRQQRKLKQEAGKYVQCTFTPNLVSKQIQDKVLRIKQGQKVQDRLLRSLEKAMAQV